MSHIFTPRPVGTIPANIERLDHDDTRLNLCMGRDEARRREANPDKRFVFVDLNSGDEFLYMGRADCGSGCRCAAEVVWIGRP